MLKFYFLDDQNKVVAKSLPVSREALGDSYFGGVLAFQERTDGREKQEKKEKKEEITILTVEASDMFTPLQGVAVVEALHNRWLEVREKQLEDEMKLLCPQKLLQLMDYLGVPSNIFDSKNPKIALERARNVLRRAMRRWSWKRLRWAVIYKSIQRLKDLNYDRIVFASTFHVIETSKKCVQIPKAADLLIRVAWNRQNGDDVRAPRLTCGDHILVENFDGDFYWPFPIILLPQGALQLRFATAKKRYIVCCMQFVSDRARYSLRAMSVQHWMPTKNPHDIVMIKDGFAHRRFSGIGEADSCDPSCACFEYLCMTTCPLCERQNWACDCRVVRL